MIRFKGGARLRNTWALSKLVIKEIFRKKDFYVAFILILVILFYAAQIQFYNVGNIVRYLRELGLALIYLFAVLLIVPLSARQYPSEVQNRTLPVLMAKPISRSQFIVGKFFGSYLAGVDAFLIFYGLFLLVAFTKGKTTPLDTTVQTAYLFCLTLMILSAMASGLSYYLTLSANVAITIILYLLMNLYGAGLGAVSKGFYYLLPHFEFFDIRQRLIHDWNPISLDLVAFLTLYALLYTSLFLLIGWLKFKKERL